MINIYMHTGRSPSTKITCTHDLTDPFGLLLILAFSFVKSRPIGLLGSVTRTDVQLLPKIFDSPKLTRAGKKTISNSI
jgi:hypothetical protein